MIKLPKLIRGLEPRRNQRLPDLGERELLVLQVLWDCGESTAQIVQSHMPDQDISLSTVQSILERLYRKRLVDRDKEGRAYRYRAMMSKSQLISGLLRDMTHNVAAGDLAPMISGFLSYISAEAPELVVELSKSLGVEPPGDDNIGSGDD